MASNDDLYTDTTGDLNGTATDTYAYSDSNTYGNADAYRDSNGNTKRYRDSYCNTERYRDSYCDTHAEPDSNANVYSG